jgi:hypothetical protein
MFTWAEVGMFFAGFLFGLFYFLKEILAGLRAKEQDQRMMNAQVAMWKTEQK